MSQATKSKMTIRGAKVLLRILWFALALHHSMMLWICIPSLTEPVPENFDPAQPYRVVLIGLNFGLLLLIPLSYWERNQQYKANWHGDLVTPDGYVNGMSKVLGTLVLPAGISTLAVTWFPEFKLNVIPLLVALVVHLANYPTCKPMESADVRLGTLNQ